MLTWQGLTKGCSHEVPSGTKRHELPAMSSYRAARTDKDNQYQAFVKGVLITFTNFLK